MVEQLDNLQLEKMTDRDVPVVYALELVCFPSPWDISSYYRELRNPASHYLVARAGERIVGYAGMWVVGDEAHVVTLAVREDCRRRGIGRWLMHALLREARQRRAARVTLEVRVGNGKALNLYASLGFRTVAFRREYYPDNGEDAAVLALDLT